jgi:uncharacterized lipoprotein YmbA
MVCALVAAGCFGASKPVEFYTLRPAAVTTRLAIPTSGLGIAVGPLQLPKYLDRPEIVTRDGEHGLAIDEWHRWGGSLRTDILRVVGDDLGKLLDTTRVAVYPAEPRFAVNYRVLIDLHEFEGTRTSAVRLRAYWSILAGSSTKALAVEVTDVERPVASSSWPDLVAAHSAALGDMTYQIAARLSALSAGAREQTRNPARP